MITVPFVYLGSNSSIPITNWILSTGFWVDTSVWKDTKNWID